MITMIAFSVEPLSWGNCVWQVEKRKKEKGTCVGAW